jgi:type II secretory pathway predicted ATPase ExeA
MDAAICSFYGFQNPPFGPAARPAPFFRTDARNALIRGIADEIVAGRAVVGLRGDHGIGKSVLIGDIAAALRARACLVVTMDRAAQCPKALQDAIAHAKAQAKTDRLVLVFDDADAMPDTMFRMLWTLSRLCGAGGQRLHLVLIGGPGLWPGLNAPDLAELRKAAISETSIPYLQETEAADYLDRKLQYAGQPLARLMTKRAIAELVAQAHGLPARLDWLAERALAFGYAHGRRRITSRRLRQALSDAPPTSVPNWIVTQWALGALAVACLAGVGGLVAWQNQAEVAPLPHDPMPIAASSTLAQPKMAEAVAPAPAPPPASATHLTALPAGPAAGMPAPVAPARPGLALLAGPGDTLRTMYDKVYRGVTPPGYEVVRAANPVSVRPGAMVMFPAPPGGWRAD